MIGANLEGVTAVNVSATKTKFQKANLKNTGKLLKSHMNKTIIINNQLILADDFFQLFETQEQLKCDDCFLIVRAHQRLYKC